MDSLTFEARVNTDHLEPLTGDAMADHYQPRTELGRKLIALRGANILAGGKLLSSDELDEEIHRRRGGVLDE